MLQKIERLRMGVVVKAYIWDYITRKAMIRSWTRTGAMGSSLGKTLHAQAAVASEAAPGTAPMPCLGCSNCHPLQSSGFILY